MITLLREVSNVMVQLIFDMIPTRNNVALLSMNPSTTHRPNGYEDSFEIIRHIMKLPIT